MSHSIAGGPYAARLEYFRHVLARYLGASARGCRLLEVTQGDGPLRSAFVRQGFRVTTITASALATRGEWRGFDVVCCCDLLEDRRRSHLLVPPVARALRAGGVLLYGSVRRRPRVPWLTRALRLEPAELESSLLREGLAPPDLVRLENGTPGLMAYAACAMRLPGPIPEQSGRWCYDPRIERWTFQPTVSSAPQES